MIPGLGHLPSILVHPGAFDGLTCPHPREFAIFEKKIAIARELARGGWALLELTDALLVYFLFVCERHLPYFF